MVNLGNVSGVVRSVQSPKEADGVTEKKYVLWAKPIGAVDEHGHAISGQYNTFYWSYSSGGWVNLDTQLTAAGTLPYGRFFIYKRQGNVLPDMEVNDMVQGWLSSDTFIRGIYLGGNPSEPTSYTIIEQLDF